MKKELQQSLKTFQYAYITQVNVIRYAEIKFVKGKELICSK